MAGKVDDYRGHLLGLKPIMSREDFYAYAKKEGIDPGIEDYQTYLDKLYDYLDSLDGRRGDGFIDLAAVDLDKFRKIAPSCSNFWDYNFNGSCQRFAETTEFNIIQSALVAYREELRELVATFDPDRPEMMTATWANGANLYMILGQLPPELKNRVGPDEPVRVIADYGRDVEHASLSPDIIARGYQDRKYNATFELKDGSRVSGTIMGATRDGEKDFIEAAQWMDKVVGAVAIVAGFFGKTRGGSAAAMAEVAKAKAGPREGMYYRYYTPPPVRITRETDHTLKIGARRIAERTFVPANIGSRTETGPEAQGPGFIATAPPSGLTVRPVGGTDPIEAAKAAIAQHLGERPAENSLPNNRLVLNLQQEPPLTESQTREIAERLGPLARERGIRIDVKYRDKNGARVIEIDSRGRVVEEVVTRGMAVGECAAGERAPQVERVDPQESAMKYDVSLLTLDNGSEWKLYVGEIPTRDIGFRACTLDARVDGTVLIKDGGEVVFEIPIATARRLGLYPRNAQGEPELINDECVRIKNVKNLHVTEPTMPAVSASPVPEARNSSPVYRVQRVDYRTSKGGASIPMRLTLEDGRRLDIAVSLDGAEHFDGATVCSASVQRYGTVLLSPVDGGGMRVVMSKKQAGACSILDESGRVQPNVRVGVFEEALQRRARLDAELAARAPSRARQVAPVAGTTRQPTNMLIVGGKSYTLMRYSSGGCRFDISTANRSLRKIEIQPDGSVRIEIGSGPSGTDYGNAVISREEALRLGLLVQSESGAIELRTSDSNHYWELALSSASQEGAAIALSGEIVIRETSMHDILAAARAPKAGPEQGTLALDPGPSDTRRAAASPPPARQIERRPAAVSDVMQATMGLDVGEAASLIAPVVVGQSRRPLTREHIVQSNYARLIPPAGDSRMAKLELPSGGQPVVVGRHVSTRQLPDRLQEAIVQIITGSVTSSRALSARVVGPALYTFGFGAQRIELEFPMRDEPGKSRVAVAEPDGKGGYRTPREYSNDGGNNKIGTFPEGTLVRLPSGEEFVLTIKR